MKIGEKILNFPNIMYKENFSVGFLRYEFDCR